MNLFLRPQILPAPVAAAPSAVTANAVTLAQQATSPKNERGTFEFAPGEKIGAFALGALIWLFLAHGDNHAALASFASFGGGAGDGVSRILAYIARDGFIGPMAFSASIGGVFFARLLRGVPVRGLSRWTCFLLSLPLFQALAVACVTCNDFGGRIPNVVGLLGFLIWIAALPISVSGGLYACDRARANKREFAASVLVPSLWAWQLFCFTPWSWKWMYAVLFD